MRYFLLVVMLFTFSACATRPRLYPNEKYEHVGKTAADADIDACVQKADAHIENEKAKQVASGAGKGAVMGGVIGGIFSGGLRGAARGAVAGGAIGATGGALSPKQLHRQFVNTCLSRQGYQVLGWD